MMVDLFGKLLKFLPVVGSCLVLFGIGRALTGEKGMDQLALVCIGCGFLLFLALFLKIEAASLRYYLNIGILGTQMLGICVLSYLLVMNHDGRWDLTETARHSLAPETKQVLRYISEPLDINARALTVEPLRSYLALFAAENPFITTRVTDPLKEAEFAQEQMNFITITRGDLAPESEDDESADSPRREHRFGFMGTRDLGVLENDIVSGIIKVLRDRPVRLYFVTGHGEKSLQPVAGEKSETRSMSRLGASLFKNGMEPRAFDLAADGMVPDDCDVLVMAGPRADYTVVESRAVEDYLADGGALLLFFDPAEIETMERPVLLAMLEKFGLSISEDLVWDEARHSSQYSGQVPLVQSFNPLHEITGSLKGVLEPIPMSRAVSFSQMPNVPDYIDVKPLLFSSGESWLVTLAEFRQVAKTGKLVKPSITNRLNLGMAIGPVGGGRGFPRIVAFGDSDFITDAQLGSSELTLTYRAASWLEGQADMLAPKFSGPKNQPIALSRQRETLISLISVVGVPFLVFFGGLGYTTMRRRKR